MSDLTPDEIFILEAVTPAGVRLPFKGPLGAARRSLLKRGLIGCYMSRGAYQYYSTDAGRAALAKAEGRDV